MIANYVINLSMTRGSFRFAHVSRAAGTRYRANGVATKWRTLRVRGNGPMRRLTSGVHCAVVRAGRMGRRDKWRLLVRR